MRMKYHEYRDEVITAMNAARNGNIISRGAIEMEIENNASRYPRLSVCKRFVIRLAISTGS